MVEVAGSYWLHSFDLTRLTNEKQKKKNSTAQLSKTSIVSFGAFSKL